jgi:hypothetical protein
MILGLIRGLSFINQLELPMKVEVISNGVRKQLQALFVTAGVPGNYTDGTPAATGEGTAIPGALCIDTTNKNHYINGGTTAQPTWKLVTRAA